MTSSMTAFARHQDSLDAGDIIWEVRSVNHRYLELNIKVPEVLRANEGRFREILQKRLKRGKIECFLRFNANALKPGVISVNHEQTKALAKACHEITNFFHQPSEVDPLKVLAWPGVVQEEELDMNAMAAACESALEAALDDLVANRKREGKRMHDIIVQRCQAIQQIVDQTRDKMPEINQRYQQKVLERIDALNIEVNQDRLEQELVHLAQKMDIDEELDRLDSHLKEMEDILERDEAIGRRLDFLMQELNREANTLGSKSADISNTNASVELKVLIEQMREQIQNIE